MGKSFFEKVYDVTRQIPKGRVATYGDIAHALGCAAYRAVGNAMNKNPYAPEVPCHRVVASDGSLGGFAYGSEKKIALLKKEGVHVVDGKVVDFSQVRFHFD